MIVRTLAPAKINWTLEVLGRRADGYHEIRTLMQTIDICDEVTLREAASPELRVEGVHSPSDDDHTLRAVRLFAEAAGRELAAAVHLRKRIPVSAGLGGGSSDAAAVLRGMERMTGTGASQEQLAELAAGIGSDAPFFVYGGTALVEGWGERVTPLPDIGERWLVVMAPPIVLADKTQRMYGALSDRDFTDGGRTLAAAEWVRSGKGITAELVYNAFGRAAEVLFEGLERYRKALGEAAGTEVHLAGAGPALFSLHSSGEEAKAVGARLLGQDAQVFVARTLGRAEATAVWFE